MQVEDEENPTKPKVKKGSSPFLFEHRSWATCAIFLIACILIFAGKINLTSKTVICGPQMSDNLRLKKILIWNQDRFHFKPGRRTFREFGCEFSNCEIYSPFFRNMKDIAAVVLVAKGKLRVKKLQKFLSSRNPRPTVIFAIRETPQNMPIRIRDEPAFNNLVDLIFTHRTDSDIYFPYGLVFPKDRAAAAKWPMQHDLKKWNSLKIPKSNKDRKLDDKKGDILWVVSHCNAKSGRDQYVDKFRQVSNLTVNIYGYCNNRSITPDEENQALKDHLFYFAFENTLCKDYISEKFYKVLMNDNIPVVRGPPKSAYAKVAPPNSFIHVDDFKSIEELASHLSYLKSNPKAYNAYFDWKNTYQVVKFSRMKSKDVYADLMAKVPQNLNPFCNFCKAVNDLERLRDQNGSKPKSNKYRNFAKFWLDGAQCKEVLPNNI